IRPLDTYNDLKFEHKASLRISFVLAALLFAVRLLDQTAPAFLFRTAAPDKINALSALASSLGLLAIWSVCNWATCTLADGEGTFRSVWIMTAYSVVPYCAMTLISIGMSYLLSQSEAVFYGTVRNIGLVWTGILLFLGMLTAHQYTVLKTIVSVILTLVMIVLCCFLLVVMFSITQQIKDFIFTLFKELAVRR
ncbi:MAG: YIP1 family protein, partial [Oscillospiraceae bacterium]|nr:YIP1 family protein [Oscillospiraceae bacterium]